jgi:carbon-monoxide dehydrogenase medium subunit
MHRTMRPFELLTPPTVKGAVKLLSRYGEKARVMAGGLDLVSKMRRWQINPEYLVSIQGIPNLCYIKRLSGGGLKIGAMASLRDAEISPYVKKDFLVLHEAIHRIASIQVKTMGTLVGNLCVATPASDIAPVLYVLGARLEILGPSTKKVIPIEQFFIPVCRHTLRPDEIVTAVLIPRLPKNTFCAFEKLAHTAACIAKVNAAVSLRIVKGLCTDARIALGSVAPCVIRASKAEAMLTGNKLNESIITDAGKIAAEEAAPISDLRSTADYRREMVAVLVRRLVRKTLAQALAK